jgi:hypothetical protein
MMLLLVSACALSLWFYARRSSYASDESERAMVRRLCDRVDVLLTHLRNHYPDDPRTRALVSRWSASKLRAMSSQERQAAKTVDKTDVYICLKDESGRLYDDNTATFVLIHELAHLASSEYGHDEAFWKNNKFLLHAGHACGIYAYQKYEQRPVSYCGQRISGNPYTDCYEKKQCDLF